MPGRLYALLVGINDYAPPVGKLAGCLDDVARFEACLREGSGADLAVEVLRDGEATRENIVRLFRSHLGRAGKGDTALFHYCGHGARSPSAAAFRPFFPDGFDEGLVCFDSRAPGGHDLADKELAVLIAELARNDPHIAVLLDCCHSGSGTRDADAFRGMRTRVTEGAATERPLESYLDGWYVRDPAAIPSGRHMLLAACDRGQTAKETDAHGGVFTSALVEVLQRTRFALDYVELFRRVRAAVTARAEDQTPQFEPAAGFDVHTGVLGRDLARARTTFEVFFDNAWKIRCGALHGMATDPLHPARFGLYAPDDLELAARLGTATAAAVGAQSSTVALDINAPLGTKFRAVRESMPDAGFPVTIAGDPEAAEALVAALAAAADPVLLAPAPRADYALSIGENGIALRRAEGGAEICRATSPAALAPALRGIVQWERLRAFANPATKIDTARIELRWIEGAGGVPGTVRDGADITLDYRRAGTGWADLHGSFEARNRTEQTLHMMLAYFGEDFAIRVLRQEQVAQGEDWQELWRTRADECFFLKDADLARERFRLFVTTEPADAFLIAQDPIPTGTLQATRALGSSTRTVLDNDWCILDRTITIIRQLDQAGPRDVSLAGGAIVVRPHPALRAGLALADTGATRGGVFAQPLAAAGLAPLTQGGAALELSDITHAGSLTTTPLDITLRADLGTDETVLPFAFDGQFLRLAGAAARQADGTTLLRIDTPATAPDGRRSLGGALKLYFFRTVLGAGVNRLRILEADPAGGWRRERSALGTRVGQARRVLLLVHGIIGDTDSLAECLGACGLTAQFDLILTYDYETLGTPIDETAQELEAQLSGAGFHATDALHLTILAHSMGGLVCRWMIEQGGGRGFVDHLVMCGTPNRGSPLGRAGRARPILRTLTDIAANVAPALIPASHAVSVAVDAAGALTKALAQMDPDSDFLKKLNASPDPGVRYTILAGDVDLYRAGDATFDRLLTRIGTSELYGLLFAQQANDIAVSVDSIRAPTTALAVPPVRRDVACHHLNYFSSPAGQAALRDVAW